MNAVTQAIEAIETEEEEGNKRISKKERLEKHNRAFQEQSDNLISIIRRNGSNITKVAKDLGYERQTIHNYLKLKNQIPEDFVQDIAELFSMEPMEVRYNEKPVNYEDLTFVIEIVNQFFEKRGITKLPPEVMSRIIVNCYKIYTAQGNRVHLDDLMDKTREMYQLFEEGIKHGNGNKT